MQDPANMPREVIRHVRERKHASTVYQFQSIEILHELALSPMDMLDIDVEDAIAAEAVEVIEMLLVEEREEDDPMSIMKRPPEYEISIDRIWSKRLSSRMLSQ